MNKTEFTGCDELRAWLESNGFRVSKDSLAAIGNECDWYAYRKSNIPARECETNDGKSIQICVKPWRVGHANALGGFWESAEVELVGEAGGIWYKIEAYSLPHAELMARLPHIEASLIAAWNAIHKDKP